MSIVRELVNLVTWKIDEKSLDDAENAFEQLTGKVEETVSQAEEIGGKMTMLFTIPFIAASGVMLKAASDAEETQNKFNEVFKESAKDANEWAESYSASLKRLDKSTKESMAIFQAMLVGLGFTNDAALDMSKRLVVARDDLTSFHNVAGGATESQKRLLSAMTGSSEAVDQFGINMKVSALEAKALELGMKGSVVRMGEMEKAVLRLAIIEDALGRQGATGDAVRTMDQFANRVRSATDMITKNVIELGEILMPMANKVLGIFIEINEFVQFKLNRNMKMFTLILWGVLAAIGPLILGFTMIAKLGMFVHSTFLAITVAIKGMNASLLLLSAKFLFIGTLILGVVAAMALAFDDIKNYVEGSPSLVGRFLEPWEKLKPKIEKALKPFLIILNDMWENIKKIGKGIIDFITGVLFEDIEKASNALENIILQGLDFIESALSLIIPMLFKVLEILIRNLPTIMKKVHNIVRTIIMAIAETAKNVIFKTADDILNGLRDKIVKFSKDAAKKVTGIGKVNLLGQDISLLRSAVSPLSLVNQLGKGIFKGNSNTTNSNSNVTVQNNIPVTVNSSGDTGTMAREVGRRVGGEIASSTDNQLNNMLLNSGAVQ